MAKNLLRRNFPFCDLPFGSVTVPSGVGSALNVESELAIEVTFDTQTGDKEAFKFVNLVNKTGTVRVHLSIRLMHSCIVLNTQRGTVWGEAVSCNFDFSAMRFWRIWLTLSNNGTLTAYLNDVLLSRLSTEISAEEISNLESNVSAVCSLYPSGGNSGITGLLYAKPGQNQQVIVHLSDELRGSESQIQFYQNEIRLQSVLVRKIAIGQRTWNLYLLDTPPLSAVIVRISQFKEAVFDVLSFPTVEVTNKYISLRSSEPIRAGNLRWSSEGSQRIATARLITSPSEFRNQQGLGYFRAFTPLSELMKLTIRERQVSTAQLALEGISIPPYSIRIGPALYQALEKLTLEFKPDEKELPSDWQMTILDWHSATVNSDCLERIQTHAPRLNAFLNNQVRKLWPSMATQNQVAANRPTVAESRIFASNDDDTLLRQALREVAPVFLDPTPNLGELQCVVEITLAGLPVRLKDWFLLQISDCLLHLGLGQILSLNVSEDFIQSALTSRSSAWLSSSITATLAARGDFERCAEALRNAIVKISDDVGSNVNVSAVASALIASTQQELSVSLRSQLVRALFDLIGSFKSAEFSGFRHHELMTAICLILLSSVGDTEDIQDEVLGFVQENYSTVPEFWTILSQNLPPQGGSTFVQLIRSASLSAAETNRALMEFDSQSQHESNHPIKVLAVSERKFYFDNFLAMHSPFTIQRAGGPQECLSDQLIRVLSHPLASDDGIKPAAIGADVVRESVRKLLPAEKVRHYRFLETLGRHAYLREFEAICNYAPLVFTNGLRDDFETEAVVIDVLVWALLVSGRHQADLKSAILRVVRRLGEVEDSLQLPPALRSAAQRILGCAELDAEALHLKAQIKVALRRIVSESESNNREVNGGSAAAENPVSYFADTLIAVITCQDYLSSRVIECRDSWVTDAIAAGAKVLFFCGATPENWCESGLEEDGIVFLPVGDSYDDLPAKVLSMFDWIAKNRPECYIVKIDDDCYLDAENFLTSLCYRRSHYFGRLLTAFPSTFDRAWHQSKSTNQNLRAVLDTSPAGTRYADGGGGYVLSRFAVSILSKVSNEEFGLLLRIASCYEDKLVGDLLRLGGVAISNLGYSSLQARRNFKGAIPVMQIERTFYPSAYSGVNIAHLDEMGSMASIRRRRESYSLRPARVWPLNAPVSLMFDCNMLEVLSHDDIREKINTAQFICVSVFRNEKVLAPHFLDHYRKMGVELFLIVDNLSDDGTREYLLGQNDVVVFSAANGYKDSHYGVDWQRTLLDHFCCGRWVIVADADEFLVTEGDSPISLREQCKLLEAGGFDAAMVLMVDMYPRGQLSEAKFDRFSPLVVASAFDRVPVLRWPLNRGPYGNLGSYVSGLRHRIFTQASPEMFTAQKVALFRFNPLMSFSEGFHFACGMKMASKPLVFLHFKYSSVFEQRVLTEIQRAQHFEAGKEYRAYMDFFNSGQTSFWKEGISKVLLIDRVNPLGQILNEIERVVS